MHKEFCLFCKQLYHRVLLLGGIDAAILLAPKGQCSFQPGATPREKGDDYFAALKGQGSSSANHGTPCNCAALSGRDP